MHPKPPGDGAIIPGRRKPDRSSSIIWIRMGEAKSSRPSAGVSHALLELARPHWKRFLIIAGLALLATGADLLQPLIYRTAINDVYPTVLPRLKTSMFEMRNKKMMDLLVVLDLLITGVF